MATFFGEPMAAGRVSSGILTSRDRKSERLFSGSHRFYKKRSMSETSSKVEIEQTPAGTGLLFRLSHKVEIPCEEAPLTSLERESPKWTTSWGARPVSPKQAGIILALVCTTWHLRLWTHRLRGIYDIGSQKEYLPGQYSRRYKLAQDTWLEIHRNHQKLGETANGGTEVGSSFRCLRTNEIADCLLQRKLL